MMNATIRNLYIKGFWEITMFEIIRLQNVKNCENI
jgi:hypothetical protein